MADTLVSGTYVYVTDNANDSPTAIGLAQSALSRMTTSIDTMLTQQVNIIFYTAAQMKSAGYTLSDGSAAWGYTPNGVSCYINTQINGGDLPSEKTQYTILHELGHQVDRYKLNSTKRTTLAGLMVPAPATGAAGWWSAGTYIMKPSENFGDTFPRAFSDIDSVLVGYYGRPTSSANYGAYITAITGGVGPSATTLAASSSIGAANIKVASVTGFAAGDWIAIGAGGTDEVNITSVGTAGAGGTGISFTPVTIASHGNNAPVTQIDGPHDPGGVGGENPTWSITINSINYTGQIPAESIVLSESGSDATATLEFTVESFDDDGIPVQSSGSEFPDDTVLLTNLDTGVRYFGGILVGCTRRHLPGGALAQDVRCVSYDSWLDRRYLPSWWTTTTLLKTGNKLADDRLIVQRIVKDGCAWLVANDTDVKSTNVAMPKLNLTDGSLRDHILATAEAAATVADPTARRVYVDFYQHVHYFKGSETRSAPYRIGDADYARTLRATTGLVAFWSLGESSGAVCRGNTATSITLSGTYVRNVTGGVVNYPKSGGVSFGAASSGLATAAALHPGNVFSVECWFKRNTISTQQTLFSAGSGDYTIEFTAANLLRLYKEGTGADFITTGTFTDQLWHHLVVTHNGTAGHIYVDGVDKNGTSTNKTMVPTTNDLYVGALHDGTLKFNGSLQYISFYNVALAQADVTAHWHDGMTLVPDDIDFDSDYNDSGSSVYVRGLNAVGTGWSSYNGPRSPYGANTIIDRPQSDTAATKAAIETAFLTRDFNVARGGHFQITGFDGWRAGQTVTIVDAGLQVSGDFEIKYIETTFSPAGSAVLTYDVYYGTMPWRGHFDIKRKRRNSVSGAEVA